MEQMGSVEDEKVSTTNQMQILLAERHGEDIMDFIDGDHAREFRNYIDQHTEILETFRKNPDEALNIIDPVVYH